MSIGTVRVPNEGPTNARIFIVGEAPGADEVTDRRPFIGVSGALLRDCLGRAGVGESTVRFTNLCQYRPQDNKFPTVLGTRELRAGLEELASELRDGDPTVIAALGNWPLYYLTGRSGKKGGGTGIGKWRGSILPCTLGGKGEFEHIKVVACYHPAFIVRQREAYPIFSTDIKRVANDSTFREFRYPERQLVLDPRGKDLEYWTDFLCASERLSCDIETVKKSTRILCHGFSPHPGLSVVISHSDTDFLRRSAVDAIYRSAAKKVFHNGGTFDIPILEVNGFVVLNYWWDTMVCQHVMWPELPKSLDYLGSVYTRQPYYKTAGRAEIPEDAKGWTDKFDKMALYEYNGTDTSVTSESQLAQEKEVEDGPPNWKKTMAFEMRQMPAAARIGGTGMLIDLKRRETLKTALEIKWGINQFVLDRLTGYRTNVNSPKVIAKILYDKDKFGLPPRRNRDGSLTTDEDAIVSLIAFCKDKLGRMKPGGNAIVYWRTRYEALKTILVIRGVRKLLSSYINIGVSEDGRVRAIYKVTGTETGRWAAAVYFDGTGTNPQTYPREVLEIKKYEDVPELREVLTFIQGLEQEDRAEEEKEIDGDTGDREDSDSEPGYSGAGLSAGEL